MKRWSLPDALSLAIMGFAVAVTAGVYRMLPPVMATHFDARGVANGFLPRALGAWLPLGIAWATWLSLRVAPVFFPASWRARMNQSPIAIIALALTACLVGLHVVILRGAITRSATLPGGSGALFGVLWLALALVMPRVRRNPLVGIRTPWALSSDENWARTHHFAGYVLAAGGLVAVAASLGGSLALAFGAIVLSALLPAVYSFMLFRRAPR